MCTAQNYDAATEPATENLSAAPVDMPTVENPAERPESPTSRPHYARYGLSVSFLGIGQFDSSAQVLFNALTMYRNERIKWLFRYAKDNNGDLSESLPLFAEIEEVDDMLLDIVRGFQATVTNLFDEVTYYSCPEIHAERKANTARNEEGAEGRLREYMGL